MSFKVRGALSQLRFPACPQTRVSLNRKSNRYKNHYLRQSAGDTRETFTFLTRRPHEAKPFTRFESRRGSPRKLRILSIHLDAIYRRKSSRACSRDSLARRASRKTVVL